MAALRGLATRVMGAQSVRPSARGGSFQDRDVRRVRLITPERPRHTGAPQDRRVHRAGRPACVSDVPGAGLEPARPRGAARFKLAVSAFHHPGKARDAALAQEPIGARHSNSRAATRCCLILLTSEGASGHVTSHPHMPGAGGHLRPRHTGMTKSRRPVTHSAPSPRTRGPGTTRGGPGSGVVSSPRRRWRPGGQTQEGPGNGYRGGRLALPPAMRMERSSQRTDRRVLP